MKLLICLFFSLCLLSGFSQNYCRTVEPGKHWELFYYGGASGSQTYEYRIDCDTILNSVHYYSVLQYGILSSLNLIGFVREDTITQKVYYLPHDSTQEILVLDYSLAVGDTFVYYKNNNPYVVSSVLTNGNCKTINSHTTWSTSNTISFEQGYGRLNWGIWDVSGGTNSGYIMIKNSSPVPTNCINSSILPAEINTYRVFPNPFAEKIDIETNAQESIFLKLYNVMGEKLGEYFVNNQGKTSISTQHLPAGIYYLAQDDGFTQKIVKIAD